jgi:hypothetical protein
VAAYDSAVTLFADAHILKMWQHELTLIADSERTTPAVAGLAVRILHDRQVWDIGPVAAALSRALTPPAEPGPAGAFIESFLAGGAEVLLQDRRLLAALDDWLIGLDEESLVELLPALRRGFGDFSETGRKRILALVGPGLAEAERHAPSDASDVIDEAFQQALPLLRTILGIKA